MKEERLIGNSGIQEVRQQCLDILAEIREQAGILNDYFEVTDSPEYIAAWVDSDGKVVFGLRTDGKTFVGEADFLDDLKRIKVFLPFGSNIEIDWDAISIITLTDSPEFLNIEIDESGKVLSSRNKDGVKKECVGFETPNLSIDGHIIENTEDQGGRSEITTDSEGKIISYRKTDGTKVENVGIETNHLSLTEEGMTEFHKDLKESGFSSGQGDWSDAKKLHISEPYCAMVNFSGIANVPQAKGVNLKGIMQFWDMNGNYFKKEVIMNAQGSSSLGHPKKNIAIDICNNNGWDDDDTFKLQIGHWVPQDSFHLKAYYMDPFRCLCPVAYRWFDQITKTRGELNDYVWKRALIDLDSITATSTGTEDPVDAEAQYNTGARCFPDGFPCIVYLNGEFYGIYAWQIKKHRDNYHMDKKNTKHIHLDGVVGGDTLFEGNIDWTLFEVRNPKDLICMDGSKYDGDAPQELIDSTSPEYDSTNKKHVNTAKVKKYIEDLVDVRTAIVTAFATYNASEKTAEDKATFRAVYESYFDIPNIVDYVISADVSNNYDGFRKNWQWITYDGVKWFIMPYDLDGVFGGWYALEDRIMPPLHSHITIEHPGGMAFYDPWLFNPLYEVYSEELESRYAELRNKKIIDADNIISLFVEYLNRIGNKEVFDEEWKTWPAFIKNDSIHRLYKWLIESIQNMDVVYNFNNN